MSNGNGLPKSHGGGPKTPRGKSIARWNALKHGATAKQLFISKGSHLPEFERYRQLAEELQEELGPGAYLEDKVLVQKFVSDALVAERCDLLFLRMLPRADDFVDCEVPPNSLRYIAQGQRDFLKSLQLIRELRGRVEETEAAEAEATAEPEAVDEQGAVHGLEMEDGDTSKAADKQSRSSASAPQDEEK
jgi:hypothetical protein